MLDSYQVQVINRQEIVRARKCRKIKVRKHRGGRKKWKDVVLKS